MIIEIFGKDFCPYCDKAVRVAQQFIQETDHTYTYQKLDRDFTREELFEQFPGFSLFLHQKLEKSNKFPQIMDFL